MPVTSKLKLLKSEPFLEEKNRSRPFIDENSNDCAYGLSVKPSLSNGTSNFHVINEANFGHTKQMA